MSSDSGTRDDRDIYRLANTMDDAVVQTMADRLEFRATDAGYVEISQAYFADLPLASARSIVAIGCGTGVEVRALRRLTGDSVQITGVDHSAKLIEAAERVTAEEGLSSGTTYVVGDAHNLDLPEQAFDIAVLHTLVSHVDDPLRVLQEALRVTRVGGTVAVFDGDYASITFGYPDHAVERSIEDALMRAIIANPRVMRDMPRLLQQAGLELVRATGYLYPNIGSGAFWANVPEAYGSVLERSGQLPKSVIDAWRAYQAEAVKNNTFFGASSYYSYVSRRP